MDSQNTTPVNSTPITNTSSMPPVASEGTTGTHYAGFWLRVVAIILDGILISAALALIGGLFHLNTYGRHDSNFGIINLVVNWLYFALMESSVWQGTIGKHVLGLKVTDLSGNKITFARATGRYFAKIVSAIILCIGFLMAGFTSKKQALHDMIAGTLVVKK